MLKTWLVSSGDLDKARARAYTPTEAFLIAVVLYTPKSLGILAIIVEEGFEGDETKEFYVLTEIVTTKVQEIGYA
jgi:hypothetical protein